MTTGKRKVFVVGDLIEKSQSRKELFSKAVFGSIVEKAKKGDVEAVRWLVEYGFMAARRNEEITIVPADVYDGIEAIRKSDQINMMECEKVIEAARDLDLPETARWVRDNQVAYMDGIDRGFTFDEEPERLDDEKGLGEIPRRGEPCGWHHASYLRAAWSGGLAAI